MRLLLLLFLCLSFSQTSCTVPSRHADIIPDRTPLAADAVRYFLRPMHDGTVFGTEAQVTTEGSRGRYTRSVAILARDPSSLRIEGIPLFGLPDFFLAAEADTMQVYLPGEGKWYRARAGEKNLLLFFDLSLPVTDVVRLLMGRAPIIPDTATYEGYCEGASCGITAFSGDVQTAVLRIHRERGTIQTIETYTSEGEIRYRAAFDDFIMVENRWYPRLITLDIEAPERTSITIRHKTIALIPGNHGETLFTLDPPPGVTIEELAE